MICSSEEAIDLNHNRIQVIGVGFGRTGTFAVQNALNILGLNCYHMRDCLENRHFPFWLEAHEWKQKDKNQTNNELIS